MEVKKSMNHDDLSKLLIKALKESSDEELMISSKLSKMINTPLMEIVSIIETVKKKDEEIAAELIVMFVGTMLMATSKNVDESISILKRLYKNFAEADKLINED